MDYERIIFSVTKDREKKMAQTSILQVKCSPCLRAKEEMRPFNTEGAC